MADCEYVMHVASPYPLNQPKDENVLIKPAVEGSERVVSLAIKNKKGRKITVEVENLNQLKSIMGLRFNTVLFDNMNIKDLKTGVRIAKRYYETEASGNINLKNVKLVASTGVNRISVGSITHSAPSIDFKLEI